MSKSHSVLFLSGSRADFGKLKPLILAAQDEPSLRCSTLATGMHLESRFGSTVTDIERSGIRSIVKRVNRSTQNTDHAAVVSGTIDMLREHFRHSGRPDMIVVHGDRAEALGGAVAGALNNVLVAHVEGGEVSGSVDESLRHAVSKLAHVHFVANHEAKRTLVQLGEHPELVFVIGSPDIDVMRSSSLPTFDDVVVRNSIPFYEYGILILHPVTTELESLPFDARNVFGAAVASEWNFVALFPNDDPGSSTIMKFLREVASHARFHVRPSLPFEDFLVLLRHSRAIVGNSSAGIREAPVYGTPTINIGSRQAGRGSGPSIQDVPANAQAILSALRRVQGRFSRSFRFGHGDSSKQFVAHLREQSVWAASIQKKLVRRGEPGELLSDCA